VSTGFLGQEISLAKESAMKMFLERFGKHVNGVVSGWDRLALRGTIRWLASVQGLGSYLGVHNILLKDFSGWAQSLTDTIRDSCDKLADSWAIHKQYLPSSSVDKEQLARQIATQRSISSGPICMLSVVEPSLSPTVVGCRAAKQLQVQMRPRKCVWIYFYFDDPQIGFGHMRLQTWLPFTIRGAINGRHWLERSLAGQGIDFVKERNCFRWLADPQRAQQLLDQQLTTDWAAMFGAMADRHFPVMRSLLAPRPLEYYWSCDQTELATDVMFKSTADLDRLFPMMARHGLLVSQSASVMRYLGRIQAQASLPARTSADIRSDHTRRHEGICVKHQADGNSVKTYNKAGNVLRVQTTINNTRSLKVYRAPNDQANRSAKWLRMRKGVADLQRRSAVSKASNERYLDTLAACAADLTLGQKIRKIGARAKRNRRSVRALNPCSPGDLRLFEFLAQGQWDINGLSNRDLARWIDPAADQLPPDQRKRLASRTSYALGILRAHKLIRKVPKSHKYHITKSGREIATIIMAASAAQAQKLMELAA
jgi:hypothetical protein